MSGSYLPPPLSKAFIWRRAHSLTGIWLVLFLIEHLLTNSQAALFIGDDGSGFVSAVNFIKGLPYLPIIEIALLGIPFLIHGVWGIQYLLQGKMNAFPTDGSTPSLPQYSRNHAYTWQRITSWILLFGIAAHVIQMRFLEYPSSGQLDGQQYYLVRLSRDSGLFTLSKRLGFDLYSATQIKEISKNTLEQLGPLEAVEDTPNQLIEAQRNRERKEWVAALEEQKLNETDILAVSKSFGMAELLMVRDTFKSPLMIFLYSGLVLAACFHAFNGLWTFMISWGITLTAASQNLMRKFATGLMVLIAFLGLAAIWGTYWLNLTT
ncbi:MAG: succinate dehydrogenase cytochrome b558 subunit [Candidatus Protochlamydia sp.]|nr:succinate dehydrogenase cytochrome b558 subunit [Candidatus Protochlamydia sp.]